MNKKLILTTLFFITAYIVAGQNKELKKIIITESNNPVLNFNYKLLKLPDSINTKELSELKQYVLANTKIKTKQEPGIFFELMSWVSMQWEHNGWNSAPDTMSSLEILKSARNNGEQYRCVEYGIVLNDILNAFGYVSRTIGLKHIDTDYGGAGMGHVATEVWSDNLQKWIFLDPQFNVYAMKDSIPLNIYEIYKLKAENKFDEIKFIKAKNKTTTKKYKKFITNYLGYIDIAQSRNDLNYSLALKMEGKRDFLTFQAFPLGGMVFTDNASDIYYKLNQTMVVINYNQSEIERTQNEYSKLNIKTVADFNKNMPFFSAKPKFELSLDNNMPWFDHYIVTLNDTIVEKQNNKYSISLKSDLNTIKVVAVNQNNIQGIPTVIKINFQK